MVGRVTVCLIIAHIAIATARLYHSEQAVLDSQKSAATNEANSKIVESQMHDALLVSTHMLSNITNPLANIPNPLANMTNPLSNVPNPLANMTNPLSNVPNPLANIPNPLANLTNPMSKLHLPNPFGKTNDESGEAAQKLKEFSAQLDDYEERAKEAQEEEAAEKKAETLSDAVDKSPTIEKAEGKILEVVGMEKNSNIV